MKSNNKLTGKKTFVGRVTSDKMKNTIVVRLDYKFHHPIYRKGIEKHKNIYADNKIGAVTGNTVKVVECRPISRLKKFTVKEIVNK